MQKHHFLAGAFFAGLVNLLPAGELTPHQQLGREIYQELVETDTSHSSGDTTRAAELLARRFRAAGFPEADVQVVGPGPTNKNFIVRYRGTGDKSPIVLLGWTRTA